MPFNCKIIYTFSLPSNQVLQTENQERERERERERELETQTMSSPLPAHSRRLKLVITTKHRSKPCHLILVAVEARCQRKTQIGALSSCSRCYCLVDRPTHDRSCRHLQRSSSAPLYQPLFDLISTKFLDLPL